MAAFRKAHRHQASSLGTFFTNLGTTSESKSPEYFEPPKQDELPAPPQTPSKVRTKKRVPWKFTSLVAGVCILGTAYLIVRMLQAAIDSDHRTEAISDKLAEDTKNESPVRESDAWRWVRGEPTEAFRDNLLPNFKYITSWPCAGWTNDVMALVHLIYLAQLTERIPILPSFAPSHLGQAAGLIPVSDVFNLRRLSERIHLPIIEWRDVKSANSTIVEEIGCWSPWIGGGQSNGQPRDTYLPAALGLDISYTPTPYSMKVYGEGDSHTLYGRLMQLGFPSGRHEALQQVSPLPAPTSGRAFEPDDKLLCFDYLYYTSLDRNFEWYYDWSPQWRLIGRHMAWAPTLQALSEEYLRRHFGVEAKGEIPKFISVHARRGDFHHSCPADDWTCLPSMDQLRERIEQIRNEILRRDGGYVENVLVMSDETDAAWWEEVKENGWSWIDHVVEKTGERYGVWYIPLLDAVFQSSGAGFVGTDSSTMSLIAALRVQDWHDGPVTYLTWKGL
ncbi:hypothetical protein DACRYDRAFT_70192 [Dacryopinax primogenitus]|uniref:GDP-fucose protein O-fucosyltransferase n=1 Tax=Dacryopinax primogenitus (strain DJM 731) TaxID=1858805 RepID=M5FU34_DACPD|nr:uncharacterized protein DACRYDRAFT_70192 [Dacryopinax primogenitus]EJT99004.1 hypothetical protein DACRYDRAFT_70192 [Dacryopinax primogenitus]